MQGCQKVLRSRLIMSSRRPWNSHQRHKFLRVKASRDILKFWVLKWFFQGFSGGIFHCGHHAVSSEYMRDWEQCRRNVPGVPEHCTVQTFHIDLNLFKYVFNVIQNWETDALQFYSTVLIFSSQYYSRRWK